MAKWKLRKDRLSADEPTSEEPDGTDAAPAADEEPLPVFDLSGNAFRTEPSTDPEAAPIIPESEPEAPPEPLIFTEPQHATGADAPIALGGPPEQLEPEEHAVEEPQFAPDPLPEFDPVVAPSSAVMQPDVIEVGPSEPTLIEDPDEEIAPDDAVTPVFEPPSPEPEHLLDVSPDREVIARGLVSVEGNGLPRVAPFILDTPAASPQAVEPEKMHSIVLRLGNLSATFILVKDVTTIGRPDGAVQNYPDVEVELDDGVSRRHAEIRRDDSDYVLVDVDSTNGTLLNGQLLTPEVPQRLQSGDRIRIGERTELVFD